jgi:hypothetical protein
MRGQGLGVFERAAGRDADRAEHVAAELDLKPASAVRGESSGRRQCDAWTLREARPFREDTGGPP